MENNYVTKTKAVIDEIIHLYGMVKENGDYTREANKMLNNIKGYEEAFKDYKQEDIIQAIRKYWKYHTDKNRPSLRQIIALLDVDYKKIDTNDYEIKKPICPIPDWQEDFDLVMANATIYGLVINPYWYNQDVVKEQRKKSSCSFIRKADGTYTTKTYKNFWDDAVNKAKKDDLESFAKIQSYKNYMLEYTFAYRKGFLNLNVV